MLPLLLAIKDLATASQPESIYVATQSPKTDYLAPLRTRHQNSYPQPDLESACVAHPLFAGLQIFFQQLDFTNVQWTALCPHAWVMYKHQDKAIRCSYLWGKKVTVPSKPGFHLSVCKVVKYTSLQWSLARIQDFGQGGAQRSFDPKGGPEPKMCSK